MVIPIVTSRSATIKYFFMEFVAYLVQQKKLGLSRPKKAEKNTLSLAGWRK
jgi:hypothetical protein